MNLDVEGNYKKGEKKVIRSSKDLARWSPGMMTMIARSLMEEVFHMEPKMKALSWEEHLRMNHVPYRRDCWVCQQTAQQRPHRRVKHPRAGVLSLDTAGPLVKAKDAEGSVAKFFLAGALTWAVPSGIYKLRDAETEEPVEVPEGAPELEEEEGEEPLVRDQLEGARDNLVRGDAGSAESGPPPMHPRDQGDEVQQREGEEERGEVPLVRDPDGRMRDNPVRGDAGSADSEPPPMHPRDQGEEDGQGEDEEEPERVILGEGMGVPSDEDYVIKVFRMAVPMTSKKAPEVTKAAMELVLRLRMDGYYVNAIHTDKGREFLSSFRRWASQRGIAITQTPGDDPQGNGRVEATVREMKSQVRRTLVQAGADKMWWPWALRYVSEMNRCSRTGTSPEWPNFMQTVLVRKRRWKRGSFEPTMEPAVYLAPSPENHGHWIKAGDDQPRLARSFLRRVKERPTEEYWLALERETLDALTQRRRLRGKTSIRRCQLEEGNAGEVIEDPIQDEVEGTSEQVRRFRDMMEEEMIFMLEDDPELAAQEMSILGKLKKMVEEAPKDEEEILQTKIISTPEVLREWSSWLPAVESEVLSLIQDKAAFKEITKPELEKLIRETHEKGGKVEVLPSKLVFTKKPAGTTHKKKARWVVCGNYEEKKVEDTYSAGADAAALRLLIVAASYHQWEGGTLDVRTAFLNADMKAMTEDEVMVIRPPQVMYEKGVVKVGSCFIPLKAVYGFRRSPKLWGDTRDDYLVHTKITAEVEGVSVQLRLKQLESEPNLWKIVKEDTEETESQPQPLLGLLMTYVDDMLVVGSSSIVSAVMQNIREKWETSEPDQIDQPIRFLGMEISRSRNIETGRFDWYLTQSSYVRDMIQKEEGLKSRKTPISKDLSSMPCEDQSDRTPEQIKDAQKAVGEALWLVTRTRPDLLYATAKMGSGITKQPKRVVEMHDYLKGYLKETEEWGLVFKTCQNAEVVLEAESDASFAPQGSESHGAYIIKVCDCPVFWRSGRQGLVSLSTAEAEMTEIVESMIAGESIAVVATELFPSLQKKMWSDSQSAVAILTMESGNWRTRHLRMRAAAARQAIRTGEWFIQHRLGEDLAIDIGTKALSAVRFEKLRGGLGMKLRPKSEKEEGKEDKQVEDNMEVAKNVLRLITVAAMLSTAEGMEEEDLEEEAGGLTLESAVLIYTLLVILITSVIQWCWKRIVSGGITQGVQLQRRSLNSSTSTEDEEGSEEEEAFEDTVPGEAALTGEMPDHVRPGEGSRDDAGSASSWLPPMHSQSSTGPLRDDAGGHLKGQPVRSPVTKEMKRRKIVSLRRALKKWWLRLMLKKKKCGERGVKIQDVSSRWRMGGSIMICLFEFSWLASDQSITWNTPATTLELLKLVMFSLWNGVDFVNRLHVRAEEDRHQGLICGWTM